MKSKIMFVDDELEILQSYKAMFDNSSQTSDLEKLANSFMDFDFDQGAVGEADFDILTACQGMDAIELVKKNLGSMSPIKVIFIDMRMPPGISGLDAVKEIRKLDDRIEFVFVTAYSDSSIEDIHETIGEAKKILYLKKPFDLQEIIQLTRNLTSKYDSERIKESFISNVSHELKTPLSSIIGFSDILCHNENVDKETREFARIIKTSGKLMQSLVSDLIDSASIQHEKLSFCQEDIDMNRLVNDVYQSMIHDFEKKGIEYELENNFSKGFHMEGDPARIHQCILKLLENALKFTENGKVTLKSFEKEGSVCFQVIDTGIGIKPEDREKIFGHFSRVEDSHHNVPGLGLGLYLLKTILDKMNGSVTVESEYEKGSIFSIFMPKQVRAA